MSNMMAFPKTFEEFAEEYKIVDSKEVYTNGTELIPIFRVKQWLEDRPTTDVVEVVRCKDCVHNLKGYCNHDFALNLNRDNYFCSYGKRKQKNDFKEGVK